MIGLHQGVDDLHWKENTTRYKTGCQRNPASSAARVDAIVLCAYGEPCVAHTDPTWLHINKISGDINESVALSL
jgi:hypothetical protein